MQTVYKYSKYSLQSYYICLWPFCPYSLIHWFLTTTVMIYWSNEPFMSVFLQTNYHSICSITFYSVLFFSSHIISMVHHNTIWLGLLFVLLLFVWHFLCLLYDLVGWNYYNHFDLGLKNGGTHSTLILDSIHPSYYSSIDCLLSIMIGSLSSLCMLVYMYHSFIIINVILYFMFWYLLCPIISSYISI